MMMAKYDAGSVAEPGRRHYRLTAIYEKILPQTLAKTHPLHTHIAQYTFNGLRFFQHRTRVQNLLASSSDLWNAFDLVHKIAERNDVSFCPKFEMKDAVLFL